jgi:hypothetical protein
MSGPKPTGRSGSPTTLYLPKNLVKAARAQGISNLSKWVRERLESVVDSDPLLEDLRKAEEQYELMKSLVDDPTRHYERFKDGFKATAAREPWPLAFWIAHQEERPWRHLDESVINECMFMAFEDQGHVLKREDKTAMARTWMERYREWRRMTHGAY